ncbi:RICIN domain-containing protein [Candidatus Saccharibacteria bacterium]|nr:RICIN domain-containing protein [Candidatus Saccharibacteria bacterium]
MKAGKTRRRDYRKLAFLGLAIFVAVFLFAFLAQKTGKLENETSAANLAEFKPGYIISDFQITDYNSMSEADIQHWLNTMNSCPNTAYNPGLVGHQWHYEYGHYICLSQERFGDRDGEIGFQYKETAAHIIWQAAQDYKINPKVLLVLLQKETGLITDPIPNDWDYRRATGYGCPDTAACSEKYYGFKNQVRNAAYLFRIVMDGNSSFYPIGNNNVRFSPNPACGSSVVYIENLATSALYRYTPYQPNAGALAAGYGTAPCGAYGNRNFFLYYQDWFGGITDGVLKIPETSYVVDGEYVLVSALRENAVIDVTWGSTANGANVQLYTSNNTGAQRWKIESDGEGSYSIINAASGKALDVVGGGIWNGTNVQIYHHNDSCAQKWKIVRNTDTTYSIYSVCSGRVLDVKNGSSYDGANVQIYQPNGTYAQKWKLVPARAIDDGEYVINSKALSTKAIDIVGGVKSAKNGTNVQVYEANETEAQSWKITYGDDGYYTILNLSSGKVLDVAGAGMSDGANVQLYETNKTCAQKWIIAKAESGYKIISACSGLVLDINNGNLIIGNDIAKSTQEWTFSFARVIRDGEYVINSALGNNLVLDVTGASLKDSANIQVYTNNGTPAQKWQIIKNEGEETYMIKNLNSGKVLDVVAGGVYDTTNVQTYSANGTCAQKWNIEKNDDKTYSLYSACSGKALDVAGGKAYPSNNVQIYTSNGTDAQKWQMTAN